MKHGSSIGAPLLAVSTLCISMYHDARLPPSRGGSAWTGGRDHTPSRVPPRWGTSSCREAAPLTPHAQPGTPAVGHHQLSRGSSTYLLLSSTQIMYLLRGRLLSHHRLQRLAFVFRLRQCLLAHHLPATPARVHQSASQFTRSRQQLWEAAEGCDENGQEGVAAAAGEGFQ
jgi:hypothetical protein